MVESWGDTLLFHTIDMVYILGNVWEDDFWAHFSTLIHNVQEHTYSLVTFAL